MWPLSSSTAAPAAQRARVHGPLRSGGCRAPASCGPRVQIQGPVRVQVLALVFLAGDKGGSTESERSLTLNCEGGFKNRMNTSRLLCSPSSPYLSSGKKKKKSKSEKEWLPHAYSRKRSLISSLKILEFLFFLFFERSICLFPFGGHEVKFAFCEWFSLFFFFFLQSQKISAFGQ